MTTEPDFLIAIAGDSIFDNGPYVDAGDTVTDHLQAALPEGWVVQRLATDGHTSRQVAGQLAQISPWCTHLVMSAGGNDLLEQEEILNRQVQTVEEAMVRLHAMRENFRMHYRRAIGQLQQQRKPLAVCTIYHESPVFSPAQVVAIALFNEIIIEEAHAAGVDVLDLRLGCLDETDYSTVSPIEPSGTGARKIAAIIRDWALAVTPQGKRPPQLFC